MDDRPEDKGFRGFLKSGYDRHRAEHPNLSAEDRSESCVELVRVAILNWLGPMWLLKGSLEIAVSEVSPENIELVRQAADYSAQLAGETKAFLEQLGTGEIITPSQFIPVVQEGIKKLDFMADALSSVTIITKDKDDQVLHAWFLRKITDLRDDMTEVLPILEELCE